MTAVIVGLPEAEKLDQENFDEFSQNVFKYVLANSDIAQLLREAFGESRSDLSASLSGAKDSVSQSSNSKISHKGSPSLSSSLSTVKMQDICDKQLQVARTKVLFEDIKAQHLALTSMYPLYMNLSQARAIQALIGNGRNQIPLTNLASIIGMAAANNYMILSTTDPTLGFNNYTNKSLAELLRQSVFPAESTALGLYSFDHIHSIYKQKQSLHSSILQEEAALNSEIVENQSRARVNMALDIKRIQDIDTLIKQFLSDNTSQSLLSPVYLQLLMSTKRTELESFQRNRDLIGLVAFLRETERSDSSRHCYWNLLFKMVNYHPQQEEPLVTFANRFFPFTIALRQDESYERLRNVLPGILPEVHIFVTIIRAFYGHNHLIGTILAAYYPSLHGNRRDWPKTILDLIGDMDGQAKSMGVNLQNLRAKPRDVKVFGSIAITLTPKLGTITPAKAEAIRPICNHCGHTGHEIQQCRKLDESIRVSLQTAKEALKANSNHRVKANTNEKTAASTSNRHTNSKPVDIKAIKKPAHNSLVTFAEAQEEVDEFNDACDSYEDYINFFAPLVGGAIEQPAKESVMAIAAATTASQDFTQFDNGATYGLESDPSKFVEAPEEIRETKVDGAFPANFSFKAMGKTIFGRSFYAEGARSVISQHQAQTSGWLVRSINERNDKGNLITVAYILSKNAISIRFDLLNGVYLAPTNKINFRPVTATITPTEGVEEEDSGDEEAAPADNDTSDHNPQTLPADTNDPTYSLLMKRYLNKKELQSIHDVQSIHAYFGHIMKSSITNLVKRTLKNSAPL